MFRKLERQIAADDRLVKEEAAECKRRADEAEARLDAPLTRREVLEAIESVVNEYSGSGMADQDLICDAFRKLAGVLR